MRRPADFDLATFWKNSTEQFQKGWARYETILRLEPRAADWVTVCRVVSPAARQADPDGWLRLKIQFENEEEACFVLMGLGSRVEVLEPPELRQKLVAELTRALQLASGSANRRAA